MPPTPGRLIDHRVSRARAALDDAGLDGLLVTSLVNIHYLTTFRGTAGFVVLTRDDIRLVVDSRYVTAASRVAAGDSSPASLRVERVDRSYDETLADILTALAPARLGVEAEHFSVARYNWLVHRLDLRPIAVDGEPAGRSAWRGHASQGGLAILPTERCVEGLRVVKDQHEIATLRTAARMLSDVAHEVLPEARSGRSERAVANAIDAAIRRRGFERPAFETIVASGPNGGLPHARPGDRTLRGGDLVVLDFGGVHDGYCVDLTRVVAVGEPAGPEAEWHAAVLEAQRAAIDAVRPGITTVEIDRAARDVLGARGFGDAFGHGTGHGLGLEVHEAPRVGRSIGTGTGAEGDAVVPGMVFTIEPGVYFEERGGVRIEDDVLVTPTGCVVLTEVDRALVVNP